MSRPAELTPRRLLCSHCGRSVVGSATCKRRSCPGYSRIWALDWRVVLLENLIAYGGKAVMFTLTPPGADVLPWDRSKCGHGVGKCSGPAGVRCSSSGSLALERVVPEATLSTVRVGTAGDGARGRDSRVRLVEGC